MTWVWTDEVAAAVAGEPGFEETEVERWRANPIAVAVEPDADPMTVARRLAGRTDDEEQCESS